MRVCCFGVVELGSHLVYAGAVSGAPATSVLRSYPSSAWGSVVLCVKPESAVCKARTLPSVLFFLF